MSAFDPWAKYYDLIHQGLTGEAEFYVGRAVERGGRVLELGCGTGRLAIPMAMCGLEVVGVDNSKAMLDECRDKMAAIGALKGSLRLMHDDITELDLGETFDTVIMAYRTLMHMLTPEQQRRALRAARGHLAPGGHIMLNTWLPNLKMMHTSTRANPGFRETGRHAWNGVTVVHRVRTAVDEYRQLLVEEHQIFELDGDGNTLLERTMPMVRAWTTLRELRHLIELEGLATEALYGDFDETPVSEESREMIWVLTKA